MASTSIDYLSLMPFRSVVDYDVEDMFISGKKRVQQLMNDHGIIDYIKEHSLSKLLDIENFSSCNYFDEEQFNKLNQVSNAHLNVFSMNIRSLPLHGAELKIYLSMLKYKFHVIVLTEIGSKNISTVENLLPDFWFEYVIPHNSTKGGVGIYITKDILQEQYTVKEDMKLNKTCTCIQCKIESLFIQIKYNDIEYLIAGVYRHPNGIVSHFNETLNDMLTKCSTKYVTIITGDINIDIMKYNEKNVSEYLNLLFSFKFLPYINLPSRITSHSATCIDHVFIRLPNSKKVWNITAGLLYCSISDHLPNFVSLKTNSKINKERPLIRLYGKENCIKFQNLMTAFDWNSIYITSNDWYGDFVIKVKAMFESSFPIVKLSRKRSHDKPWITTALKISIAHNHKLYKKSLTSHNIDHENQYKTYNNILRKCIKKSESNYYTNLFEDKKNASINTWKALGPIINPSKTNRRTGINKIKHNGKLITENKEIANVVNNYFCEVGKNLAEEIPNRNNDFRQFLPPRIQSTFYLSPVNQQDVLKEIKKLKPRKAAGPDNIGNKIIQLCPELFSYNLTTIYNHYIEIGEYPQALKIAKVIPIYKKGQRDLPNNYRPISLLSVFDKIFEKLICHKLVDFIEKNNILYEFQFGFRKLYSTTLTLIELTDKIRKQIDDGNIVLSFFVDFTKAFDTVDHKILLDKLDHYGFRGHAQTFLKSYLTNRSQFTFINGVESDIKQITCGVPQGSVLGPILFLLYVNDLHLSVNNFLTRLFADDTCLSIHHENTSQLKMIAKTNFKLFAEWCECNKLTINYSKTHFILFHAKNKKIPNDFDKIEINNNIIKRVNSTKYLVTSVCH